MEKPLTVTALAEACQIQIKKGNGSKIIMISDDDEGNGFHYLWYQFCEDTSICDNIDEF